MNPPERILQRIGVLPPERALFGWAATCLMGMGAAAFALLNTSETLFLKRVGVEALPMALLASSGMLVLTTALAGRAISADPPRWLPRVLLVLSVALLPFAFLAESQSPIVFGAFVLVSRQVLAVGMLCFWVTMGTLVPARRSKQLFAPLASGVTLGGIVGSFGSEPLSRVIGVGGLIAVCALLLVGAAAASRRLRKHGTLQLGTALARSGSSSRTDGGSFVQLTRGSLLFRLLLVVMLCGGALSPVLYFEFSSVLDAATQGPGGEQQLLSLYSQFRGWLNVAMLGSQLWLSTALYGRIGLPLSIALLPATYVLGFGWISLAVVLPAAFGSFGAARLAEDGIADSATRVLYNLFPIDAGAGGRNVEWARQPGGGVLGNSFVLAAIALGAAAWVGWLAIPVACVWLGAALILWRAYPRLLLRASAEHGLAGAGIDKAALLDPATFRRISSGLLDEDPRVCRAALDLLVEGEDAQLARVLAEAVVPAPASNRGAIVDTLHRLVEPFAPGTLRSDGAVAALAAALRVEPPLPPEQRADLLQVYARLTGGDDCSEPLASESRELVSRSLGDRAAPVRLAAVAELSRRGAAPPGLPDFDKTLADALVASDALVRRAARKELRAMLLAGRADERWNQELQLLAAQLEQRADRADTAEALREIARRHGSHLAPSMSRLLPYLGDRDPRVRGALLAVVGHAGLAQHADLLVAALAARAPEEVGGAREGLVALGAVAALPLLVGLEFGGPVRREAVVSVLRELEVDADTLDKLIGGQLDAIRENVVRRAAVDGISGGAASLLLRRLDEQIGEGIGALLDLLAARHDDPRLSELERRLRRSPEGRDYDLLVEAIEAVLGRAAGLAIVPLLESGDPGANAAAAAAALGRPIPRRAEALAALSMGTDGTAAALAKAVELEAAAPIGDSPAMPSSMEIAVFLQDVPAFSRLGTQQLLGVAELVQERRVAAGERIYAAGEEGHGLYFVFEGQVELRRGGLLLETAEAGGLFGELSSLDGVPRSADAIAKTAGRVLRLERDDLFGLLEQAPGLAIGFAQLLSTRVRRLTDRLEDANPSGGSREEPA